MARCEYGNADRSTISPPSGTHACRNDARTLHAPNATATIAWFLGALSTSIAIDLILEMKTLLDGTIRVSLEAIREALVVIGPVDAPHRT